MSASDTRCPQCSALLRADVPWCTLCHADLRPDPDPEPVLLGEADADPATDPLPRPDVPAGAAHARPAPPSGAETEAMLAELRAQSADPLVARMGGRLKDPGFRLLVMVGGTLALAVVLLASYAVLGLVLG